MVVVCQLCLITAASARHARRWNRYAWLFRAIDRFWASPSPERERLWNSVEGQTVLEIGVGTGRDMQYYPDEKEVVGIDISSTMIESATRRATEMGLDVDLQQMDAENMTFEDDSFDCVVSDVTLCCCPDARAVIREVRRVLAPDGRFVMMENVRADVSWMATFQDLVVAPVANRMGGGYFYRDTPAIVESEGFELVHVESLNRFGSQKFVVAEPTDE